MVAGLGVAEGGVRLYARSSSQLAKDLRGWDPFGVKVEPHGRFGYRQRPGVTFSYPNGTRATVNAEGWRGPVVAVPKPAGTVRIVLLGESATHGYGVNDDETIDAYMRRDLAQRLPGHVVEVVNLAFDGYDAYQAWQRWLTDGVRLQPDAVVLNTGINDVRNARYSKLADPDPRTLIWEDDMRRLRGDAARGGPTLWSLAKHYLYLARLPGVIRQGQVWQKNFPTRKERVYQDAADNFELNVGRVVTSAVGLGVPVLLSTTPSALTRPDAPANMEARSYWVVDPRVTQAYRDTLARRLARVARESSRDHPVRYVAPDIPSADFLDDCHLKPAGNLLVAARFSDVLLPLLEPALQVRPVASPRGVSMGPPFPRIISVYPPTM